MNRILSRSVPYLRSVRDLVDDRRGATAIEYSLIAMGISIVIVAAVRTIGTQLATLFTTIINGFAAL
jgi:pilus assembly protein Flp/PilA